MNVDFLLINIPLEETTEIGTNEIIKESQILKGLRKSELKELLSLRTKDLHFIFDGIFHEQIDWPFDQTVFWGLQMANSTKP